MRRVLLAEVDGQLRARLAAALRSARLDVVEVAAPTWPDLKLCHFE